MANNTEKKQIRKNQFIVFADEKIGKAAVTLEKTPTCAGMYPKCLPTTEWSMSYPISSKFHRPAWRFRFFAWEAC